MLYPSTNPLLAGNIDYEAFYRVYSVLVLPVSQKAIWRVFVLYGSADVV